MLPLVLGVDVVGKPVIEDLIKMPHLLVGGATGSGKSVGLNTMLVSLLCCKKPEDLRLILVDPKRLEFTPYADVPHLLFPIVTEPNRAVQALKWVVQEMEERYEIMSHVGVRNVVEYKKFEQDGRSAPDGFLLKPMPFIVVIIDELADLMIVAGKEVETQIVRIAQMARAAGIHMIVATQRPSVDVVTGLIKVNFPSRVAFRVSSKVDSRTILDAQGAEKLLGRGYMLYMNSASSELRRVHGAYLSDAEIEKLADFLRDQAKPQYLDLLEVLKNTDEKVGVGVVEDELYPEILNFVKTSEEISISMLQRKYSIGFNRSARIIEKLELDGIIAPAQGSKPRKVLRG
jgi:S-DNA-T family DNA segregation ATPase FtsK/SpoIIIE